MRNINHNLAIRWLPLAVLTGLIPGVVRSQNVVAILASPFKVITTDSNYSSLEKKMPSLICNGILYTSNLRLVSEPKSEIQFERYFNSDAGGLAVDSARLKGYRRGLDSLGADYYLNGEIWISNGRFYLNINATDFSTGVIRYRTTKLSPISDFQKVIDEASENIDRQVRLRLSGGGSKKILINNFYVSFGKGSYGKNLDENVYAPDFISRFLSFNLKNTSCSAILPFSASETLTFYTEQEKAAVLKPDFVISGNILFDNNNSWLIQPVVSDNWNDSLVLQPLQGSLQNKEELLARVLNEVQLFLNTIDTTSNNLASLKSLFLFNGDYQRAFDSARSSKNYDLALYYASKIPDKKDLLTAEVSYDRGDYDGVLESLHSYIGKDSVDVEIYYYYGLAYIKKGRYQSAKEIFSRINEELLPERNLHYQLGVCLYHQDSLQKALDQFTRQLKMSESPMDIYAYIGSIYMNRDEWKQAEESYLYLYRYDTSNVVYKRYLSDFYLDVADSKYKKKAYHEAGIYYKEAYTFGRSDQSLLGAITAFAHAGDEDSVYSVVAIAANDTLADLGSIYVEASVNCRVQRDEEPASFPFLTRLSVFLLTSYLESPHSSVYAVAQELGSDYFRLRKLDSAEYFYKIALTYNGNEPTNYFNLAELQIIELKADSALATLEKARLKFHLDTTDQKGNYLVKDDYYEGIYLIYSCQANILMKKDINKYYYRLKRILSKHKRENPKNGLFSNWSFVTYLTWLNSEGKISITIKRLMMENLCVISEYTYDTNFSCELK